MNSNIIRPIDKSSVHRICSGQVVLTLSTAVKELIENALDASATYIEIKLKNKGLDLIEILDNGTGIEEINFSALTIKHATSKIASFDDIVNAESYGFRGEALSSLCALSKLSISTRHISNQIGSKLSFDSGGNLLSKSQCPRQIGTTVMIENLFSSLPVRRCELERNIKREFNKMINVIGSYCLINKGLRLLCTDQASNGKKTNFLNVGINSSTKEIISSIFGTKQLEGLIEFEMCEPSENIIKEFNLDEILLKDLKFRIEGYLSSPVQGEGRSSQDRQFIFVNKRPIDSQKVSRIINEVYHMFNRNQNPFVLLDITTNRDMVDVNVTPDKRQIFMQNEKIFIATLKASIMNMFNKVSGTCPSIASPIIKKDLLMSDYLFPTPPDEPIKTNTIKRTYSQAFESIDPNVHNVHEPIYLDIKENKSTNIENETIKCSNIRSENYKLVNEANENNKYTSEVCKNVDSKKWSVKIDEKFMGTPTIIGDNTGMEVSDTLSCINVDDIFNDFESNNLNNIDLPEATNHTRLIDVSNNKNVNRLCDVSNLGGEKLDDKNQIVLNNSTFTCDIQQKYENSLSTPNLYNINQPTDVLNDGVLNGQFKADKVKGNLLSIHGLESSNTRLIKSFKMDDSLVDIDNKIVDKKIDVVGRTRRSCNNNHSYITDDKSENYDRKVVEVEFSMLWLKGKCKKENKKINSDAKINVNSPINKHNRNPECNDNISRKFIAKITPNDNKLAESELQKVLSKDMFEKMIIIGQFNLGFIIAKLLDDLFIIDQHATDEKYNFENMQRNIVLESQKLIRPQSLELTRTNQSILLDNIDIFKTNGFGFEIQDNCDNVWDNIKLTSIPISKNWIFGKSDIEEMIFMLSDQPGVMIRPSRIRDMLASRACRASIMIGTSLNNIEMKKLVTHMGEIEQPWNCPHGRPTIRHLVNLSLLRTK